MTRPLALAGLLALAFATPASAGYIGGVTVTTNWLTNTGDIAHILDGSGLSSSPPSLTSIHAAANASNSWIFEEPSPPPFFRFIDFDLHGDFILDFLLVWNYNGDPTVGVKDVTMQISLDGVGFFPIFPTVIVPEGANNAPESWSEFGFFRTEGVKAVRFLVFTNYGSPGFFGLSEVAFFGDPVVPVPPTLLLGLIGAGCVARLRRRGR
jgi:hypothetical protein